MSRANQKPASGSGRLKLRSHTQIGWASPQGPLGATTPSLGPLRASGTDTP